MSTRLLYVTRKYPPAVGGMEALAATVADALGRLSGVTVDVLALGRSQRHLAWFLPAVAARTAWRVRRHGVTHVLAGDPVVLAALGPVLPRNGVEVAVVAHGLDLLFPNPVYQAALGRALPRAGRVLAISHATAEVAARAGVPEERVAVVLPAVPAPPPAPQGDREAAGRRLRARLGVATDTPVVATVGRLVRRKGVRWFVAEVLPRLDPGVRYVVAGDGADRAAVEEAVQATPGSAGRVHLLGTVPGEVREDVVRGADLFVMPNLSVPGDMEGFGLVAVEAALRGAVVVAADLEGIADATAGGACGITVAAGDPDAFAARITDLLADRTALAAVGDRFAAEAAGRFSVDRLAADLDRALGLTNNHAAAGRRPAGGS